MKKKRGTIAVLIILALLILGIGYAVLSNTLTISGSATAVANDDNFEVVFANANSEGATTTNEPSYDDSAVADTSYTGYAVTQTVTDGATEATFSVEDLTTEGDTVVLTFPIENRGIVDATIAVTTDASVTNTEYFSISTELSSTAVVVDGSTNAIVTVECLKTPTDADQESGDVTITLTATAAE